MVFTGLFDGRKPGEYTYLSMSDDGSEDAELRTGVPPYEWMGREISFDGLPEACRERVLGVYRKLWGL